MKKIGVIFLVLVLVLLPFALAQEQTFFKKIMSKFSGSSVDEENGFEDNEGEDKFREMNAERNNFGLNDEEYACMHSCASQGCAENNMSCTSLNREKCSAQCNVEITEKPEPANEQEACMQECILQGCEEFDFNCQKNNMESCEDECGMKGDAPDESEMSEEQKCIHECVKEKEPTAICGNSKEGETGGKICRKCAKQCEHLYEGPCLGDKELKEKQKECETCKHCYGEPVMGDSGEGWECIVGVECKDATSEWGDTPGEGPGIGQEGYVNKESIGEKIGGFFKGLFGNNDEENSQDEELNSEENSQENINSENLEITE